LTIAYTAIVVSSKQKIVEYLAARDSASGAELREYLEISRQAVTAHLRQLVSSGTVVKSGATRGARYSLASRTPPAATVSRDLRLKALDESEVYEELATLLNLRTALRGNVESIARYALTEMLNNAIEHSEAERCKLRLRLEGGAVSFDLRDRGIGAFHSIASRFHLPDENAAMIELLKGRTTTMPEAHSGEGIFFTARAADRFILRSHRIQVEWDSAKDDVFVSKRRFIEGTEVRFLVQRSTRRRLEDVFGEFAPEEYDFRFEKTRVHAKLLQQDYVSRSEAKRLLANMDKFSEIELDFRGVESIGQGFADEIFRVFAERHPEIAIETANTNDVIDAMLSHVRKP
jgi:biotin operon repressor